MSDIPERLQLGLIYLDTFLALVSYWERVLLGGIYTSGVKTSGESSMIGETVTDLLEATGTWITFMTSFDGEFDSGLPTCLSELVFLRLGHTEEDKYTSCAARSVCLPTVRQSLSGIVGVPRTPPSGGISVWSSTAVAEMVGTCFP